MRNIVYQFRRSCAFAIIALLLSGCASSETRSLVSQADIPAAKYKHIALFIEGVQPYERDTAEQALISSFQSVGITAVDGNKFLADQNVRTEKTKAAAVQRQFDAVVYFTVLQSGKTEKQWKGAYFDGQAIKQNDGSLRAMLGAGISGEALNDYIIKPDGSVYQSMLALKAKVDLQDTKSAKLVWTSETIGYDAISNTTSRLFDKAANQIVEKMRKDGAI